MTARLGRHQTDPGCLLEDNPLLLVTQEGQKILDYLSLSLTKERCGGVTKRVPPRGIRIKARPQKRLPWVQDIGSLGRESRG